MRLRWNINHLMSVKRAIVCVTNDLTTDQRVDRTCITLTDQGFSVILVGRKLGRSLPLVPRTYAMHRMQLWFNKGPLFYANYNIRLFLYLIFHKSNLIVSNDLDTLPACFLAYRLKNILHLPREGGGQGVGTLLLHDCHEYFRGVPELVGRKGTTRVWKWIEDRIFPKLQKVVAVNASVAKLYREDYGNEIEVIRNVPFRKQGGEPIPKEALGILPHQKVILYQGAVNLDRGLEEVIQAMKFLRCDAKLVIAGTGDKFEELQSFVLKEKVPGKVIFTGQIPFQDLYRYTLMADLGLSIEKDVSLNYHFALPNKFLDYIQANVPVLISPFPEMKAILDKYFIGEVLESHDPKHIAEKIDGMLLNETRMELFKENLLPAAEELCWENEAPKLKWVLDPGYRMPEKEEE
ncbi:MAG: glycosyltransferase [Bacteroidales bacterium]|nr:glycosyltransferase [Bacteroidales bacterium]